MKNLFFKALNIEETDKLMIRRFAKTTGIPIERLSYYNRFNIIPSGKDLLQICDAAGITEIELFLKMGVIDSRILSLIKENADQISQIIQKTDIEKDEFPAIPPLVRNTNCGKLYQGDCLDLMQHMDDDCVDLIFADPPFNLNKLYPSNIDDNLKSEEYLRWCKQWLDKCIRILKPGGSLFIWNLPKWNTYLSEYLNHRLTFRHWISVDIKYTLPIKGRLYPSHYSLIYYCKGEKPNTFHPDRLPMDICPHCVGDLKDYGGYKNKMNPDGINLTDVWFDIPPVRHKKYKKRNGSNELSIKLIDRIIEMASDEGDLVFDPFGGSGTTYAVAEIKKRKWIGIEIGPVDGIIDRLDNIGDDAEYLAKIRKEINCLITNRDLKRRIDRGWWTPDSVRKENIKFKKVAK
ncbi:MAG: site-specific DNA-methyltransferase [Desulfobacterium sp.]|nr:site-specific DNA-methyltransferase [Desulfobacterium sp.]MBU3950020.1 site-specific DNA-methyltransferase [Pseudomonadota bacterium]MBU4036668.1 site-specific DNA-methyltransferase [Pseudomonadota bacterium]